MVNFIMQEAQEKVQELNIKVRQNRYVMITNTGNKLTWQTLTLIAFMTSCMNNQTEHDFNLEKQKLVREGKLKLDDEYVQKEKDLEIQQRVARSQAVGAARVKKMQTRDDLLGELLKGATEKLVQVTKSPTYPTLIKQLIVEGLIKIEEQTVEIQARAEDKSIVARMLPEALSEFRTLMSNGGHTVNPKVTISDTPLDSKKVTGGILLTAHHGRITLNQTLDERLAIAFNDNMPEIRKRLF